MDFSQYVFGPPYFGWLCRGVLMTLLIAAVSGLYATVTGFLVQRCHISTNRALRGLGAGFVMVFRNLPLVPLLLFLTFAFPDCGSSFGAAPFRGGLSCTFFSWA